MTCFSACKYCCSISHPFSTKLPTNHPLSTVGNGSCGYFVYISLQISQKSIKCSSQSAFHRRYDKVIIRHVLWILIYKKAKCLHVALIYLWQELQLFRTYVVLCWKDNRDQYFLIVFRLSTTYPILKQKCKYLFVFDKSY